MSAVNTAKAQRRSLTFTSIDDVIKEVDRILAAEKSGKLKCAGNWEVGTIFNHLASWINYGYEGFPAGANPPWIIKFILRTFMKNKYLRNGMNPGVKIPGSPNGTFGTEVMSIDEGAKKLKAALMRLKNREPVKFHSPAFGEMPDEERIAFQLRHAELHLSFLHC